MKKNAGKEKRSLHKLIIFATGLPGCAGLLFAFVLPMNSDFTNCRCFGEESHLILCNEILHLFDFGDDFNLDHCKYCYIFQTQMNA